MHNRDSLRDDLIEIFLGGIKDYGRQTVTLILTIVLTPFLISFVTDNRGVILVLTALLLLVIVCAMKFRKSSADKNTGKSSRTNSSKKSPKPYPHRPDKPITGTSKYECAHTAYIAARSCWNSGKDAYSAYVWLILAVKLGIKDNAAQSFMQEVSHFDDTLRKKLSVQQINAANNAAQNMLGSVQIQPRKTLSKHSAKPADIKRTMQERIARKLVNAVGTAKPKRAFTVMRKVLKASRGTTASNDNPKQ